ncbi:hypothetical protein K3495_g1003 [Podosphaera aphanis]|nr:hypothetical protein K3495_g1003 [Podosphaera aphanis]
MARNERAVIIIGSSVGSAHRSDTFREAVSTRNAVDLWNEVKLLCSNSDGMVMSSILLKFYTLNFDPDKIKIADYYAEIIGIKKMLQDTGRPITDEEILDRICLSINGFPLEKLNWHNAHYTIRTQKLSLPAALILLKEAETLTPSAAQPASLVESHGKGSYTNRDKNRRGRGGYRGSGRGGAVNRGRGKQRGGHTGRANRGGLNSRGKSSNNNNNSNLSQRNDICGFCQEPGHWQRHCQVLKRSRQQYLHSKSKQNDMEYAQIATEQINDNRFDYSYSRVRANIVIETALVSTNKMKISWKIDSGATRHFSGRLGDFSGLKRWSFPKSVSIADGNTCSSDGYGTCKIGDLILKDVWYVSAFKDIGLISVGALNKDGVRLVFENCFATATKDSKILFKAPLQDNLFQLSHESMQTGGSNAQFSFSAHQSGSTETSTSTDEMSRLPSNDAELWHFRLAHASYKTISKLPNIPNKPRAISKGENACEACLAGKMKETYSKKTVNRMSKPARRLHADISGKLPTTVRGYNYFLVIIDDASRCGWIHLLKNKSTAECLPAIKAITAHVQLSSGEKVAHFTADNGTGEFGQAWKDWCKELGIEEF